MRYSEGRRADRKAERVINFASGSFKGRGISARTLRGSPERREIGNNVVVGIAEDILASFRVER